VSDLVANSAARIKQFDLQCYDDVVHQKENIIKFSPEVDVAGRKLKKFLFERFYRHPTLVDMNALARKVITDLFDAYLADSSLLNEKFRLLCDTEPPRTVVKDYIAGMTDRFALQEHKRIMGGLRL